MRNKEERQKKASRAEKSQGKARNDKQSTAVASKAVERQAKQRCGKQRGGKHRRVSTSKARMNGSCLLQVLGVALDCSISKFLDSLLDGRMCHIHASDRKMFHSRPRLIRNSVVAVLIRFLPFNLQPKLGRRSGIITTIGNVVDSTKRILLGHHRRQRDRRNTP